MPPLTTYVPPTPAASAQSGIANVLPETQSVDAVLSSNVSQMTLNPFESQQAEPDKQTKLSAPIQPNVTHQHLPSPTQAQEHHPPVQAANATSNVTQLFASVPAPHTSPSLLESFNQDQLQTQHNYGQQPPPPQMYSPLQFSTVPPPSSISNLAGYQIAPTSPQQPFVHPQAPFDPFRQPSSTTFDPTAMSYAPQRPAAQSTTSYPPMQMYSSFPQVQIGQDGAAAVTTPISLPGMPPITVSTTIPPGMHFNNATPHQN